VALAYVLDDIFAHHDLEGVGSGMVQVLEAMDPHDKNTPVPPSAEAGKAAAAIAATKQALARAREAK